jgi:hypothetical protein
VGYNFYIQAKINFLNKKEKERFNRNLIDILGCKHWLIQHGFDYSNPNVSLVKETLFKERYERLIDYSIPLLQESEA